MIHEPDNPISNNRRRILEATSQLIAEKGVTNTTVSDIVDRVGISRGTLHYYYKSKNELIYDITTQHLDELSKYWLDKIAQVNEPIEHLPELLKETLESFVHAERPGTLNLYLIHDAITGNEKLRKCFFDKYEEWRQSIVEVLNTKALPDSTENEVLSYMIIAMIDGLVIQWLLGIQDIPFNEISKRLLR